MICSCLQAYAMNERIGYPDFIKNESKLNDKYDEVSTFRSLFIL